MDVENNMIQPCWASYLFKTFPFCCSNNRKPVNDSRARQQQQSNSNNTNKKKLAFVCIKVFLFTSFYTNESFSKAFYVK